MIHKNEAVLRLINDKFGIEYTDLVFELCKTEHNLMMWMSWVSNMIRDGIIVGVTAEFGHQRRVYLFPNGTKVSVDSEKARSLETPRSSDSYINAGSQSQS